MKKCFRIFALTMAIFSMFNITAFANSGPSYWYGADSANIVMRENCPLVVEKEVLTFDIYNQLDGYYGENEAEKFSQYTDKFTAEYTFYNPTDKDITAQLAFPLGMMPEYVNLERDMSQYSVSLNGTEIEKEIRYTKSDDYYNFDYSKEAAKLTDGYIEDDFYYPDMLVTKYTLIPKADVAVDYQREMRIMWDGNQTEHTRIIPLGCSGYKWEEGKKAEFSIGFERKNNAVIYAIGQPLENFPEYSFYDSWKDDANQIEGSLEIKEEQTTLQRMLTDMCENLNTEWNVSPMDTYNMFVSSIAVTDDYYENLGIISTENIYFYKSNLICWYLYKITVPAGQTVTNTVTAPLYPDITMNYTPYKYGYKYLLSPAQNWADFGEIEININTPYYILEINQENFEKTETGYVYKGMGLPDGELEFTVSASEKPKVERNYRYLVYLLVPIFIAAAFVALFVVLMIKLAKKKK